MKSKVFIYLSAALLTFIPFTSCSDDDNPVNPPEPKIRVLIPNGGEVWNRGGQRTISWENDLGGDVSVELLKAGELYTLLADTLQADTLNQFAGEYLWFIPEDIPATGDYSVRVTSLDDPEETDESDGFFRTGWPLLSIYDPPEDITIGVYDVQWYGNSNDSTDLTYYYCISTDTLLADSEAVNTLGSGLWSSTSNNYAPVSFPVTALNSVAVFTDSTAYTSGDITVQARVVFSKFFLYAKDAYGASSPVVSRVFGRTNRPPQAPSVHSDKLKILNSGIWTTVGPDSAVIILSKQTAAWDPIDFSWRSEDPDGPGVELEFRWELWERERVNLNDNMIALAASSAGWSAGNTVSFAQEIWDHNYDAQYAFKVFVRDDALEESDLCATVNFEVFPPSFDKGILVLDDTDPSLYIAPEVTPTDIRVMGNPDPVAVREFYEELLDYAGFEPDTVAADPLNGYKIKRFQKGTEFVYWEYIWADHDSDPETPDIIIDSTAVYRAVYEPDLEEVVQYRLVIIASDDRGNINGVDFAGEPPYTGYNSLLSSYLDVGGKMFILGPSVLMGKTYTSPNQLPVHQYKEPFTYAFDGYTVYGQGLSSATEIFFRDYFGISEMTFPEQKTTYIENVPNPALQNADYKYSDNHDYIGTSPVNVEFTGLNIDSVRVNDAFFDRQRSVMIYKYALKDNGTVFTGVPSFSISKGEEIYRYRSLYDLPVTDYNDSLAFEYNGTDTLFHKLYWEDVLTSETGPVLHRTGTVASRYADDNGQFKTAFFGMPSYFMDNSGNEVSEMFKAMVDWFDLSVNPADNWKKK